MLRHFLTSIGFAVEEAANGPSAIEAVGRRAPDLILMDQVMPGLGGTETLARLRDMPGSAVIPAIAISASALDGSREHSLGAGFAAFLAKPVRFDELLVEIGKCLALTWIRRPATVPESCVPGTREDTAVSGLHRGLLDLARRGDIRAIQAALQERARAGGGDDELLRELTLLAERYDMKGIRELLTTGVLRS